MTLYINLNPLTNFALKDAKMCSPSFQNSRVRGWNFGGKKRKPIRFTQSKMRSATNQFRDSIKSNDGLAAKRLAMPNQRMSWRQSSIWRIPVHQTEKLNARQRDLKYVEQNWRNSYTRENYQIGVRQREEMCSELPIKSKGKKLEGKQLSRVREDLYSDTGLAKTPSQHYPWSIKGSGRKEKQKPGIGVRRITTGKECTMNIPKRRNYIK